MAPYSARIYVVYELRKSDAHPKGTNQFYLGWADKNHGLIKQELLAQYEQPTEYLHYWMKARQPTYEEASRNIAVTYLWHVYYPRTWSAAQLETAMNAKLDEWITRYFDTGRLLNTRALPLSVRNSLPSTIATTDKHFRVNVAAALTEVLRGEDKAEMVGDIQRLIGCLAGVVLDE